jgi:hypothetical protein
MNRMIDSTNAQQESEYITAEQARELGAGNAMNEPQKAFDAWFRVQELAQNISYSDSSLGFKAGIAYGRKQALEDAIAICEDTPYRAIKQAQPEPTQFKRENRYIVLKNKDVAKLELHQRQNLKDVQDSINSIRSCRNKPELECVVVESDDPAYEQAWKLVEQGIQPEPADPHATLRAEYAKQVKEGTRKFYLWEYLSSPFAQWIECKVTGSNKTGEPSWEVGTKYQFIDISCMVALKGEPAKRMLRTEAQELQRSLGDTVEWLTPYKSKLNGRAVFAFSEQGIYTYAPKATIKLDGKMVTPEQAAAEWKVKKEMYDFYSISAIETTLECNPRFSLTFDSGKGYWYETRPKQPTWIGSRDGVIALLKEKGLL